MCHKPFDFEAREEAAASIEDQIYRPGEDIPELSELERSQLREELQRIFDEARGEGS